MKKLFYLLVFIIIGGSANAQTPFITNENTLKALTLDEIHGGGAKPWGWWVNGNKDRPRATLVYEHVVDRYEKELKAAKFTARLNGEERCTWHINAALSSGVAGWIVYEDYSPYEIELETDFYYTFWAKAEVEGSTIDLGTMQVWSPNFVGVTYTDSPQIKLTTNWTKYAIMVSWDMTLKDNLELTKKDNDGNIVPKEPSEILQILNDFRIHFRSDIDLYIDDIEMYLGDELPDDVGNYFIDGVEYARETGIAPTKAESFHITSTDRGAMIDSKGGNLTVYNVCGQIVLQETIGTGKTFIHLDGKALYVAVLEDNNGKLTKKFFVN